MQEISTYEQIVAALRALYGTDLAENEREEHVRWWLSHNNPDLGLATAHELIQAGRGDEVLELVEDLVAWQQDFE